MSSGKKSVLLILLILLVDQVLKIWVKTHMDDRTGNSHLW